MKKMLSLFGLALALCNQGAEYEVRNFRSGYTDMPSRMTAAEAPLENAGAAARLAFPWKQRMIWIDFGETENAVSRIEFKLEKIIVNAAENRAGLDSLEIYRRAENDFVRVEKYQITHRELREGKKIFDLVTLTGDFTGRALKFYQPREKPYVFGFTNMARDIRVFREQKLNIESLNTAPVTGHELKVGFQVTGGSRTGEIRLAVEPGHRTVFRQSTAGFREGEEQSVSCSLTGIPAGVKQLTLEYLENGIALSRKQCHFRLSDTPEPLTVRDGEIEIPAGTYAVYFELSAASPVTFQDASGKSFRLKLDTWHPNDLTPQLRGEACGLVRHFAAPETLRITGGEPLAVRIQQVSAEQAARWNAPPEIVPAMILHDDGYSPFYLGKLQSRDDFRKMLSRLSRIPVYEYDWCAGVTTAVNYPSRFASNFGYDGNFWREGDRRAAETVNRLIAEGDDPVKTVGELCREYKIRYSLTLRANACYPPRSSAMNGKFYQENPQLRQMSADGQRRIQLSYAFPETRRFVLNLIGELAAYKPDAITIEFLRHPPFFGYDAPLVEIYKERHGSCTPKDFMNDRWQKIQCEIMNEFMAQVRRHIDAASPGTALEVSFDSSRYYQHGLDVKYWLEQGYPDLISPGIYHIGEQKFFPVEPFAEMIKASPRRCLLFPRVEATIAGNDPTPDEEKGLVKIERKYVSPNMFKELFIKFRAGGADGLRPFNAGSAELAGELADRSSLKRFEEFEMPLLNIRYTPEVKK